jgi:hypothetical protein
VFLGLPECHVSALTEECSATSANSVVSLSAASVASGISPSVTIFFSRKTDEAKDCDRCGHGLRRVCRSGGSTARPRPGSGRRGNGVSGVFLGLPECHVSALRKECSATSANSVVSPPLPLSPLVALPQLPSSFSRRTDEAKDCDRCGHGPRRVCRSGGSTAGPRAGSGRRGSGVSGVFWGLPECHVSALLKECSATSASSVVSLSAASVASGSSPSVTIFFFTEDR